MDTERTAGDGDGEVLRAGPVSLWRTDPVTCCVAAALCALAAAYYVFVVPELAAYLSGGGPVEPHLGPLRATTVFIVIGAGGLLYRVREYAQQRLTVERCGDVVRFSLRSGGKRAAFEWRAGDVLGVAVGGGRREGRARRHLTLYATNQILPVLPGWSRHDLEITARRLRAFLGLPDDAQHPGDVPPLAAVTGVAPDRGPELAYERPRVRCDPYPGGTTITLPPRTRLNGADVASLTLALLALSGPLLAAVLFTRIGSHWSGLVIGGGAWLAITWAIVWAVVGRLGSRTRIDVTASGVRVTATARRGGERVWERPRDRIAGVAAAGAWVNTRRKDGRTSLLVVADSPAEAEEVAALLRAALELDAAPAARTLSGDE